MRFLVILLLLTSCGLFEDEPEISVAGTLPYLKIQNNIGAVIGFNPSYPEATLDSFNVAWEELKSAGMSVGRLQIDWEELEPEEGVYDMGVLEDRLIEMKADGLQPFMTLAVHDSEGPVLPPFLEGSKLSSSEVLSAFNKLMDWFIPMMVSYDGWGITISNEPDNFYADDKELDDEILAFTRASRAHIHSIDEKFAVSVTMNIENLSGAKKEMKRLLQECDVLSMNLYGSGLFPLDQPYTEEENEDHFEEVLDFANGKQIIIQELGMHADIVLLNSSEEIQRAFFAQFFQFMEREDQVRAAFQFTMIDWSEEVLEIYNSVYEEETPQWFIDQYSAVLKALGLINFETGECRVAFNEFVKWCEEFRE